MKLYRNAIILVVVLALLLGVYGVVRYVTTKNEEGSSTRKLADKLIDLASQDIVELTIQNENEKLVFEKKDDKWYAVEPQNLKIDSSKVNSVAINFASVLINQVVEEEATDLSVYGLDKPTVITAKLKDGTVATAEVGDQTPTGSGYYAKEPGKNKVYIIDSYTGSKIRVRKNDLRSLELFYEKPEDIIKLQMGRNGQLLFTARKAGEYNWEITEPINGTADYSAIGPMLEAITGLTIREFVEENVQDPSKYGFSKPLYSFKFDTGYSTRSLLLGNYKTKGSEIYAMIEGTNEVFTVSVDTLRFIDKPLEEIFEVFVYITNIWDVSDIVVNLDGERIVCKLETHDEDKEKDKFYVNGKDASFKDDKGEQPFRKFYQSLIGVTLSKIDPGAEPQGQPEITFEYTLKKEPYKMKVEFVPKDEYYYYVIKNGVYSGILVEKDEFDKSEGVRESYRKLMEAMEANKQ